MTITQDQLARIMPNGRFRAPVFIDPLNAAMQAFSISDNALRESAFLAQIAHESGELRYVQEIASGQQYEGRKALGNTIPGDGIRYKGRGLIQITGRSNYAQCGHALELDLLEHPELLETRVNACRSAAWFWQTHGLNELADAEDFLRITKRINGGTNGLHARLEYYERAKAVLVA